MGAWGEGVFESDAAGDWADELSRTDRAGMIAEALQSILRGERGSDESSAALAAAEVVAAARGWPMRGLYPPLKDWLGRFDYRPSDADQRLAMKVVAIIRDDSELADELSGNRAWHSGLERLLERLAKVPQPRPPVKPRKALPAEVVAAIQRLDQNQNTIELTKGGSVKSLQLSGHDDETLRDCLPHLTTAKRLRIDHSAAGWPHNLDEPIPVGDAAFVCLDRFSKLEELILSCTLITDATLARISGLTKLKRLWLVRTPITDAGLAHLSGLVNLEHLALGDSGSKTSRLTAVGLACLRHMTKLKELDLWGTGADDSVLTMLSAMPDLYYLELRDTKVKRADRKRHFREAVKGDDPQANPATLWFMRPSKARGEE